MKNTNTLEIITVSLVVASLGYDIYALIKAGEYVKLLHLAASFAAIFYILRLIAGCFTFSVNTQEPEPEPELCDCENCTKYPCLKSQDQDEA